MTQSQHPAYQASGGSMAPIMWYESLPEHVKRLYVHKSTFSQQPALMVILAEVVCEAFTIWTLEELFKKKKMEDLWKAMSYNKSKLRRLQDICNNEDVQKIYMAVSGDHITQTPFWEKLKAHSERRNNLVHPNHTEPTTHPIPSPEEANESFKAVEDYIQHVHSVLDNIK